MHLKKNDERVIFLYWLILHLALFQCDYNAKPHQKLKINSVKFAYNEFNVIYIANQYYLKKYSILIF